MRVAKTPIVIEKQSTLETEDGYKSINVTSEEVLFQQSHLENEMPLQQSLPREAVQVEDAVHIEAPIHFEAPAEEAEITPREVVPQKQERETPSRPSLP